MKKDAWKKRDAESLRRMMDGYRHKLSRKCHLANKSGV